MTALLHAYPWAGHVRELRDVLQSLLLTPNGREVRCKELPKELLSRVAGAPSSAARTD